MVNQIRTIYIKKCEVQLQQSIYTKQKYIKSQEVR